MFVTLNVMKSQVKMNESLKYVIRLPNHGQSMFHLHCCNRLVMNQSAGGFLLHFQPCCWTYLVALESKASHQNSILNLKCDI